MSEAEFERLLNAVRGAIAPTPHEDFVNNLQTSDQPPKPANDNGLTWPLIPFPEGWFAVC